MRHKHYIFTFANDSGQSEEPLSPTSSSCAVSTYTEELLLALKITEVSLLSTAISPSITAGVEKLSGVSLAIVVREEFRVRSGLSRDSFSCLRAPARSLVAFELLLEEMASRNAGRSSPDRTVRDQVMAYSVCLLMVLTFNDS